VVWERMLHPHVLWDLEMRILVHSPALLINITRRVSLSSFGMAFVTTKFVICLLILVGLFEPRA